MPNVPTRTATSAIRYLRSQRPAITDATNAPGITPIEMEIDCDSVRAIGMPERYDDPGVEAQAVDHAECSDEDGNERDQIFALPATCNHRRNQCPGNHADRDGDRL